MPAFYDKYYIILFDFVLIQTLLKFSVKGDIYWNVPRATSIGL